MCVSRTETAVPTRETASYPSEHEPHPADRRRRRRRHRSRGRRRGPQGAARGRRRRTTWSSRPPSTTSARGAGTRTGETLPDTRPGGAPRARRDPARRGRRPVASRRGVLERGLLLRLRFELDHHVNLRPVTPATRRDDARWPASSPATSTWSSSARAPRARTPASGGVAAHAAPPHEVATEESLNTRFGVERVVRDAFARAAARPRRQLTLVHKNNVLVHAGDLWTRTSTEVAADFPEVTHRLPARRRGVDVLRDASRSASTSSSPTTCSATSSPTSARRSPAASAWPPAATSTSSRHQPEHVRAGARLGARTSPGQGKADPTATVLSVAMLLDHLGLPEAAARRGGGRRRPRRARRRPRATTAVGDALAARVPADRQVRRRVRRDGTDAGRRLMASPCRLATLHADERS